ncbi:hypothetical protein CSC74_16070 [Pseudoxanthomonas yeongjuensis]|uniref:DUF4276 family protein n=1 Tax=Pseudoxanthomonas yeongjuensis TaxID=377616 RepID=UPI001390B381|nr:DUF4276 family protein [Pseudoxanthomonas yeongjuensis]KAF1714447.1 hypothetical protein CSC74_16070 [Pseudoxanthomonas yeongjuensis]
MSKIGMIFECGPEGADLKVCKYLAEYLRDDVEVVPVTLDNKANLLRDAGKTAKQLLVDGCCCVLIIWDLRPAWPDKKNKPCRTAECQAVLQGVADAGVTTGHLVHLICIEQELESWLLTNERAISELLSTSAHPYQVSRIKRPDRVMQPKAVMVEHFKTRGWRYDDKVDAIRVLRAADIDVQRMRRSESFSRFEQKLVAC